jgi:glyoxylase-like metal-dependent hydrolase (beta-lactamase superfamily II)
MTGKLLSAALLAATVAVPATAQMQQPVAAVRTERVAEGVYALFGDGGNIGVSAGDDGVFIIDDQFAPLTPAINAALAKLNPAPVRFVLNTHWHYDHVGGNENYGKAGAVIIAQDNVRARMSVPQAMEFIQQAVPASPPAALPVVTFNDSVSLHFNGDEVRAVHVAHAHTDGDAVIHFRKANVIHAGDTYFNGLYPFIDVDSGGGIAGTLAAVDVILAMADDETRIIPGHGPLSGRAELEAYRKMLVDTTTRVRTLRGEGRTVEEIVAAAPNADYDRTWGWSFVTAERYVQMLCYAMEKE